MKSEEAVITDLFALNPRAILCQADDLTLGMWSTDYGLSVYELLKRMLTEISDGNKQDPVYYHFC